MMDICPWDDNVLDLSGMMVSRSSASRCVAPVKESARLRIRDGMRMVLTAHLRACMINQDFSSSAGNMMF
jgi:hypothetical protein